MFIWYNKIEGDNQIFGARYSLFEVALNLSCTVYTFVLSNADNATIVDPVVAGVETPTSINVHPDCVPLRVDCQAYNVPNKEKKKRNS